MQTQTIKIWNSTFLNAGGVNFNYLPRWGGGGGDLKKLKGGGGGGSMVQGQVFLKGGEAGTFPI